MIVTMTDRTAPALKSISTTDSRIAMVSTLIFSICGTPYMATVEPKASKTPEKMAGLIRGSVTVRAVLTGPAPDIRADSSRDGSMLSRAGNVCRKTMAAPVGTPSTTRAHSENTLSGPTSVVRWKRVRIRRFTSPAFGPARMMYAMVRRKGGVMMATMTAFLISAFPAMLVRLTPNARGTPTRTLKAPIPSVIRTVLEIASMT